VNRPVPDVLRVRFRFLDLVEREQRCHLFFQQNYPFSKVLTNGERGRVGAIDDNLTRDSILPLGLPGMAKVIALTVLDPDQLSLVVPHLRLRQPPNFPAEVWEGADKSQKADLRRPPMLV